MDNDCPCGFSLVPWRTMGGQHAQWHRRWQQGHPLAHSAWPDLATGTVSVEAIGQHIKVKQAYYLAQAFKRENHYDLPCFPDRPFSRWDPDWRRYRQTAFLAVEQRRAVGAVFLVRRQQRRPWQLSLAAWTGEVEPMADGCWAVAGVWVAADHRRRGVATALVQAAVAACEVPLNALGWDSPLTAAGRGLARALSEASGRIWVT